MHWGNLETMKTKRRTRKETSRRMKMKYDVRQQTEKCQQ
jgi:hypothetical protein